MSSHTHHHHKCSGCRIHTENGTLNNGVFYCINCSKKPSMMPRDNVEPKKKKCSFCFNEEYLHRTPGYQYSPNIWFCSMSCFHNANPRPAGGVFHLGPVSTPSAHHVFGGGIPILGGYHRTHVVVHPIYRQVIAPGIIIGGLPFMP